MKGHANCLKKIMMEESPFCLLCSLLLCPSTSTNPYSCCKGEY
ncbi:hypothetical protein Zm00014a_040543 [Zea mays]|uniref:Uncharacterized protein n=1 Tax=Zea mays TaxID=4577 RepID=A0A3L6F755_MAIZE|nr:hypothetical protein Zm00014a_040543 [Zea mays]